jgi:hypothetical protein
MLDLELFSFIEIQSISIDIGMYPSVHMLSGYVFPPSWQPMTSEDRTYPKLYRTGIDAGYSEKPPRSDT